MNSRRAKFSAILVVAAVLLLAGLGIADQTGYRYTDQGFKRALVTFAVARGLNAVISVAQGTELAVQPAGVGVNFAPGQVLDPINDLVEQFSWVMLASATSLGIQKLLLNIFSAGPFTFLLGVVLLFALLVLLIRRFDDSSLRLVVLRAAAFLIVLRFAVPVFALLGEGTYALFMQDQYEESARSLERATEEIRQANKVAEDTGAGDRQGRPKPAESILDWAKRFYASAAASVDIDAYIDRYQTAALDISEQVVNLIVIFVVQTILLPLAFLWGMLKVLRYTLRIGLGPPVSRQPAV